MVVVVVIVVVGSGGESTGVRGNYLGLCGG